LLVADDVMVIDIAFILQNVYTEAECNALIAATEKLGYAAALVNVGAGRQQLMTDVRNNDRCMVDDTAFADHLYNRIKSHIPMSFKNCEAVSLNERLRFLRYDPGQKFAEHYDGVFMRDNGMSLLLNIFSNHIILINQCNE
jgi:predicted 2-oxoglutarate/Fe(II)-dependent dioxygenase YbiX